MRNLFDDVRMFCANPCVEYDFCYIEFFTDNTNSFQEMITMLSDM